MKKNTSILGNRLALLSLIILLPSTILSYIPVITLGIVGGVHIDLSLLYLLLATVILLHLPFLFAKMRILSHSLVWKMLLGFTGYTWLSTLWSPNHIRGVITASFMIALLLLCSIIALRLPEIREKKHLITRLGIGAFMASGILALWQIITDTYHLPSFFSGLPIMYSGDVFGIARPTAFALEPQFFGNLLLIPFLWSAWHILARVPQKIHYIIFISSAALLLLTLSRGALIAAFIGYVALLLFTRPSLVAVSRTVAIGFASIIIALGIVFAVGTLRSDSISGTDAVKRTINQLSIGIVDFTQPRSPVQTPTTKQSSPKKTSGYIATSTDSRLSMSDRALSLWQRTPLTVLFGVGIGGFGASLQPSQPGAIVNNYYLEMLVETGIIGTLLLVTFIMLLFRHVVLNKQWLLLALLAGLLIQMNFFSGNANIIHMWMIIGIAIGISLHHTKSNTQVTFRSTIS